MLQTNERRLTCLLCSLVILCTSIGSRADDAPPLLWRINSSPPSYLFGTIHSAHPQINQLPALVTDALDSADRFYGELDMSDGSRRQIEQLFMQPAGENLRQQLNVERWNRGDQILKAINPALSLRAMEQMQLWAVTVTLPILDDQLRYAGQPMMDQRLFNQARDLGLVTGGLETAEQQAAIFSQLSLDEQLALFDTTLDYMERAQQQKQPVNASVYEAYLTGDPDDLIALMRDQLDLPLFLKLKLSRLLLTDRNRHMAEQIDALMTRHPGSSFFFAVGAAHMAGAEGVPALLESMHYDVRRVQH